MLPYVEELIKCCQLKYYFLTVNSAFFSNHGKTQQENMDILISFFLFIFFLFCTNVIYLNDHSENIQLFFFRKGLQQNMLPKINLFINRITFIYAFICYILLD